MGDDETFCRATVDAFQSLQLESPELTSKLLKRPPFRFIHDIVCGIDARYAAYSHVIPEELRNSAQVDTKEKKIAYLTLLVEYLNKLMNVEIDVNPKKVVAGQEPEKTNVFLQYLAAGVGYAQQDKAARATAEASNGVPEVSTKLDTAASPASPLPQGGTSFPSSKSLPRKKAKSIDAPERRASPRSTLADAAKFNQKLAGFSLNLNIVDKRDIRAEGQSMIRMWTELAQPQLETKPTHMPEEALVTAISRQIETIKMVQELLAENDHVIENLESIIT